jgi:hypothetical protein
LEKNKWIFVDTEALSLKAKRWFNCRNFKAQVRNTNTTAIALNTLKRVTDEQAIQCCKYVEKKLIKQAAEVLTNTLKKEGN